MQKVFIVGNSGAGKSTFAKALAEKVGYPICHLDIHLFNQDWSYADLSTFKAQTVPILKNQYWIAEGKDYSWFDTVWDSADTIIFLMLDNKQCLQNAIARHASGCHIGGPSILSSKCEPPEIWQRFKQSILNFNTEHFCNKLASLQKKTIYFLHSYEDYADFLASYPDKNKLVRYLHI